MNAITHWISINVHPTDEIDLRWAQNIAGYHPNKLQHKLQYRTVRLCINPVDSTCNIFLFVSPQQLDQSRVRKTINTGYPPLLQAFTHHFYNVIHLQKYIGIHPIPAAEKRGVLKQLIKQVKHAFEEGIEAMDLHKEH